MSELDRQLKAIHGKAAMRETVYSLDDGDQAILLVWRGDREPYNGKRHAVQYGCDTKALYCFVLQSFLHDEFEGRFDPPEDDE